MNEQPYVLISGDFNGDGKTDLLTGGTFLLGNSLSLTATGGTPQSTPVGTTFPIQLQATLRDGANPVSRRDRFVFRVSRRRTAPVRLCRTPQAITDASGVARMLVTANQIPGTLPGSSVFSRVVRLRSRSPTTPRPVNLTLVTGTQQSAALGHTLSESFEGEAYGLIGQPGERRHGDLYHQEHRLGAVLSSGTALTDSSGFASVTARAGNLVGPNTITASVGQASVTFVVFNGLPSTVTLAAVSPNPSTFGAPVTLTATVSPSNATGRIIFYDGVTVLGARSLSGGSASLLTGLLAVGPHKLRAYYLAGTQYAAASSNVVTQTVNAQPANAFTDASCDPAAKRCQGISTAMALPISRFVSSIGGGCQARQRRRDFSAIAITPRLRGCPRGE